MADLFPEIGLQDQILEAKRELAMRERVYPRQVAAGNLPAERASRQIETMRAIIETLERSAS